MLFLNQPVRQELKVTWQVLPEGGVANISHQWHSKQWGEFLPVRHCARPAEKLEEILMVSMTNTIKIIMASCSVF